MPWGVQRLNAKRSQPNPNIVFIKPLKGQDEAVAQDFLERIAAQCCRSTCIIYLGLGGKLTSSTSARDER